MFSIWVKKIRFRRIEQPVDADEDRFAFIKFGCYRKWDTFIPEEEGNRINIEWTYDEGRISYFVQ